MEREVEMPAERICPNALLLLATNGSETPPSRKEGIGAETSTTNSDVAKFKLRVSRA
jgi:hypothetical protein